MISYAGKRLVTALGTILTLITFVFLSSWLLPGGPADLIAGIDASDSDVREIRRSLGLDRSFISQYFSYLFGVFRGDFGTSIRENRPVTEIIFERARVTAPLAALSFFFSGALGITFGLAAALGSKRVIDMGVTSFNMVGLSLPEFWLGIIFVLFFAVKLKWFPFLGIPSSELGVGVYLYHLFLPSLTLSIPRAAALARLTRANILEEISKQYILTARAKGLGGGRVALHIVRGAMPGSLQLAALELGGLLSGTILVEQVFALPGLGSALLGGLSARDYPVVVGISLIAALSYILANIGADLLQVVLDPRIHYG